MLAVYAPMSVGDYCKALNEGVILVNEEYQRNSGVWASHAKSFFIESILLQYPIPKLFLYSKVDLKTRTTVKEIVDGQQRSHALQSFYNRKFKLSSRIESEALRGLNYNQLPEEYQSSFISYQLPIDEFRGVQPMQIQESFRRMNASNVPLNDEEQRNAKFQGPFKWFIQRVAKSFSERLRVSGVFSRRDLIRMVDHRFYADIFLTIDKGFVTVKSVQLDDIYRKYNVSFEEEDLYFSYIEAGIDAATEILSNAEKELLRVYMAQSLVLVLIDRRFNLGLKAKAASVSPDVAARLASRPFDLLTLINSLREPDNYEELTGFIDSTKGTNVNKAKADRFLYLDSAL